MKKTVIITGATDGIGKALAILLEPEYNLALCGRLYCLKYKMLDIAD